MSSKRAPTIIDVAREAGVSIKTVSRVLNQEPGVHSETREQVLKVVAELNYRPKLSARALAGARSYLIGLLYYDPSAAFVAWVQQGPRCAAARRATTWWWSRWITTRPTSRPRWSACWRPCGPTA